MRGKITSGPSPGAARSPASCPAGQAGGYGPPLPSRAEEVEAARLHPVHYAWRLLPRDARRSALLHLSTWLAPRPGARHAPVAPGLAVTGELDRPSGLGEAARLVLQALAILGIPSWAVRPGDAAPPPGVPLLVVGYAPGLPLELMRLGRRIVRDRMVIGYWFWELPLVPGSWAPAMRFVHRLWAPSCFTASALASLSSEVQVVPVPAAVRAPAPSALGRAEFGLPSDAFVTLVMFSLASSFERKNPLGAIEAHRRAFGSRADRVLLLHVTNPHHFPADFARLREAADAAGNIRLHTAELSRADTEALVLCSDVVLSLHRSEGLGLVPAEAMLLGRPVIATGWSATAEFMAPGSAGIVPAALIPARDPRGVFEVNGAVWADPDVEVAALWLRQLAADPEQCRRMGEAGRRLVQQRLGAGGLEAALQRLGAGA